MFLAKAGEYEPCGIFSMQHFELIIITTLAIIFALKNTVNKTKEEVKNIIKKCTIIMWILEIIMITFKLCTGDVRNLNNYVPLYYCSLLLYAGAFSSFGKGILKRTGDVFLATGGIIGGLVFIILPTTSLPSYPMLHIVSLHSFFFHGTMIYLGLLIDITHYVEINASDIKYFATLVGSVCVLAYIINKNFDSNLMFISQNFPGMPIEIIYNATGRFYTLVMSAAQMTLPFYCVYGVLKLVQIKKNKNLKDEEMLQGGQNEKISIN